MQHKLYTIHSKWDWNETKMLIEFLSHRFEVKGCSHGVKIKEYSDWVEVKGYSHGFM